MTRTTRWIAALAAVVLLASGCSIREVQAWFAIRGNPSVTAQQAKDIADKINAKSPAACDSNYADFCVPNNQTSVRCAGAAGSGPEVGRVRVVGWDHFGLDPDGDRVGCDSPPPPPPTAAPPTAPPTTTPPTTAAPTTTTTAPPATGGTSFAYVADTNAGAIRKIDTVTLTTVATYSVGGTIGFSLARSGNRIFYLTTENSSAAIGAFDIATLQNDRAFITTGIEGGLLRTSPALPGRLFSGAIGVSPGSVSMYDVSGATGSFLGSSPFNAVGTMTDFDVSADGTRVWAASSNQELTEFRTSDLALTGRRFPASLFPMAVASATVAGSEILATGTGAGEGAAFVFAATDPASVTTNSLEGRTSERALAFSADGSKLYAVVEGSGSPELVTMATRTDRVLRAPLGTGASPSVGDVAVDPATGRVFVAVDDSLVVFNPDGSFGRTLAGAAPRSVVFSSTGVTGSVARLAGPSGNTGPPTISTFTASRTSGPAPLAAAFRWSISDPDAGALTCRLDLDANGTYETTVSACTSAAVRSASYSTAGARLVRLRVSDGSSTAATSLTVTPGAASADTFGITIRPNSAMTTAQRNVFTAAAARWAQSIKTGLSDVSVSVAADDCVDGGPAFSGTVDDLTIDAIITPIDGSGGVLGSAGPCIVRTSNDLPLYGVMVFDSADVADLEAEGLFSTVVLHEMAHVLGFGAGPQWDTLLSGAGTVNVAFTGEVTRGVWNESGGTTSSVPIENSGGAGTADGHWRETTFGSELMTGFINPGSNPLTRFTLAAFADLGYGVDLDTASGVVFPVFGASLRSWMIPSRRVAIRPITPIGHA